MWLTGVAAGGKTALLRMAGDTLRAEGYSAVMLDGGEFRAGINADLGFSAVDRYEAVRRTGEIALALARAGQVVLVSIVSLYADDRDRVREIHLTARVPFIEAWVPAPLAVCERRDPRGLYARVRRGQLKDLTGVNALYAPPRSELVLPTQHGTPNHFTRLIVDAVKEKMALLDV